MLVSIPTSKQIRFKEKQNGVRTQDLPLHAGPSAGTQ